MVKMNDKLRVFNSSEFGDLSVIQIDGKEYFPASDCAKMLGYTNPHDAIGRHCVKDGVVKHEVIDNLGRMQATNFINEGNLYRLIVKSKLPSAEKFERWVFDDVLPTIRKTGGYVANEDLFINTYLPNADEQTKILFKTNLVVIRNLNDKLDVANKEIEYKENIIINLVDDVDLATKRQRLQDIMRKGFKSGKQTSEKWGLLYKEFEKKYHIDLNRRMNNEEAKAIKPKIKNKLDYIDRVLNKIPEIYELACKLFENDVQKLKKEWFEVVDRDII